MQADEDRHNSKDKTSQLFFAKREDKRSICLLYQIKTPGRVRAPGLFIHPVKLFEQGFAGKSYFSVIVNFNAFHFNDVAEF